MHRQHGTSDPIEQAKGSLRHLCLLCMLVRSSLRPHNANELPGKLRECRDSLMDTLSEANKIEILRTRNNALMVGIYGVQVSEIFPIVRHNRPAISTGISQHGFVREFLLSFPHLLDGLHVVP
jgi:hypothetical protein